MAVQTGDPVILVDAEGLEEYGVKAGDKGWANSVTTIPGEGSYVFFMPEDKKEMLAISSLRLEVDEEAKAKGIELDEKTISKG